MRKLFISISFLIFGTALAAPNKVVLDVPSIVCMSCVSKITTILKNNHASDISVSVEKRKAHFSCAKEKNCDETKILAELEKANYSAKKSEK